MKRVDLIRHLERHGCRLLREGGSHSVWYHPTTRLQAPVPRHREIGSHIAAGICRQLGIPKPPSN